MTEPKENEEINEEVNEELSTDELKSVSGGGMTVEEFCITQSDDDGVKEVSPQGSGFGGTLKDWERANKSGINWDLPDTSSGVY